MHRGQLLTIALAIMGNAARLPSASPLQPTGPWKVNYSAIQCVATRDYGSGHRPLTLVFEPSFEGSIMHIEIISSGFQQPHEVTAKTRFGSADPRDVDALAFSDARTKMRVLSLNLPMAEFRMDAGAKSLDIESSPTTASFALSQTGPVLAQLDKCLSELQHYWGLSDGQSPIYSVPPRGDLRNIFTAKDYPAEAVHHGLEGSAQFLLLVDENGKVIGCDVVKPSGIPVFDAMGCAVMKERAKFSPARDASGKPVRSAVTTPPVVWLFG